MGGNVPDVDPQALLSEAFTARSYQTELFTAYREGKRRFVTVWHRRAGKDLTWFNWLLLRAMERKGAYYYVFPTYAQGKKILWEGMDKEGRRFLDYCPAALIAKKNDSELSIEFRGGSTFRIIGADNPDSIVGTNPVGIVFSEFSLQRPNVWDLMRPILAENDGWAGFNFTPRGMNHAYDIYEMARGNPDWYVSRLTVEDTDAVPLAVIDSERDAGMSEEMIQQEFYVSFEAGQIGAYYGNQMRDAEQRITSVPWDPHMPVYTAWDLGVGDATAIGFFQVIGNGREWRWIDYYEASGEGVSHYVKIVKEKPYTYGEHYFPQDVKAREWMSDGKTREDVLRTLGITPTVVTVHTIMDGIEAVRGKFPAFWFDREHCQPLITALRSYHKLFDEDRKVFKDRPDHDWASHSCDMVRYAVMGYAPTQDSHRVKRTQQMQEQGRAY